MKRALFFAHYQRPIPTQSLKKFLGSVVPQNGNYYGASIPQYSLTARLFTSQRASDVRWSSRRTSGLMSKTLGSLNALSLSLRKAHMYHILKDAQHHNVTKINCTRQSSNWLLKPMRKSNTQQYKTGLLATTKAKVEFITL